LATKTLVIEQLLALAGLMKRLRLKTPMVTLIYDPGSSNFGLFHRLGKILFDILKTFSYPIFLSFGFYSVRLWAKYVGRKHGPAEEGYITGRKWSSRS
jgi:hypothetical protein